MGTVMATGPMAVRAPSSRVTKVHISEIPAVLSRSEIAVTGNKITIMFNIPSQYYVAERIGLNVEPQASGGGGVGSPYNA